MNLLKAIALTALIFFAICAVIILATLFIVTNLPMPNFLNLKHWTNRYVLYSNDYWTCIQNKGGDIDVKGGSI